MPAKPQLSIGLPVYNGEASIAKAIDSLLAQQWNDFELIISDNGSTDKTPQICQEYVARDQRVSFHRSPKNQGVVWNFNNVFQLASCDYFMMAAHDDYWHPRYVQSCMDIIKDAPSVVLVSTACDFMDKDMSVKVYTDPGLTTTGLSAKERFQKYKIYCGNNGLNAIFCGVYRREVLSKVLPYRRVIALDYVALNGLSLEGEFYTLPEALMKKRKGGDSTNFERAILSIPIKNSFLVKYSNLVREYILQGMIFKSSQLNILNKIILSFWSMSDFFRISFLNRTKSLNGKAKLQ